MARARAWIVLVPLAVLSLAIGAVRSSAVSTCTWTGGSGADWNTTADWNCGHIPTSSDDVVINQFGSPDVTTAPDANARTVSVAAGGGVTIETGRSLTVSTAGSSSFAGTIGVNGTGTLTLGDPTTWSSGVGSNGSGTINVNSSLSVTGAASMQGTGVVHIGPSGSMTVDPGSAKTVDFRAKVDNDGTCVGCAVNVSSGTLELDSGDAGSTTGSYTVASGATLQVDAGTFDAPSVTGSGTFFVAGGSHLTVGSTETFSPGTLTMFGGGTEEATLNANVTVAHFSVGNGTRDGTGTLTVTDTASLSGTLNGGTTRIATATSATIDSSIALSGATLTLDAPTTSPNVASIQLGGSPSTLNVNSSLDITGTNAPITGNSSSVVNIGSNGALTADPGAGQETDIFVPVNNQGTVTAHTGTLELFAGSTGTNSGGYVMDSAGTLEVATAAFSSPSITGAGTFFDNGPTVTVGSTDTFSPTNLKLNNGGTLTLAGNHSIVNLLNSGGIRNGSGTLTITGSAAFDSGSLALNAGTTTIAGSASPVVFDGGGVTMSGATLNLDTPTTVTQGGIGLGSSSTMNINSTFAVTAPVTFGFSSDSVLHVGSTGSLTIDPGSGQSFATQTQIHNDGVVNVASGTASSAGFTQSGGTTTVAAGAELDGAVTLNGGTLKGNGTLGGPVENASGTVAPGSSPGTLAINGNFTQDASGTLQIEVDGKTANTQFDVLQVGGNATLGGTVALVQGGGFTASDGDTFVFMPVTGTLTGQFANLTGAAISGGGSYSLDYQAHAARLVVGVPLPSNQVKPSITGTPAAGQTLTCNIGSWSDVASFTFEWLRDGVAIAGATSQQYAVTSDDQGHSLSCRVTGTNSKGSTQTTSDPVSVPAPTPVGAPANTKPPSLPSSGTVGQRLTCDPGTWTGSPALAFQWLHDAVPIAGATSSTYTLTDADAGHQITCRVTATNAGGSATATSNAALVSQQLVADVTIRGNQAFSQGTSNDVYLACTKLDLLLVDVVPKGTKRVTVLGAADLRLVGKTADILLGTKKVGTALIGPDGSFSATVAAPPTRKVRNAVYQARVGSTQSQELHLERRMIATTLLRKGNVLVLSGIIAKPFAKKPAPIAVERYLSCQQRQNVTVPPVVPDRQGRFSVKIPIPNGAKAVVYRALTRVARRPGGNPSAPTFTLPRAIDI